MTASGFTYSFHLQWLHPQPYHLSIHLKIILKFLYFVSLNPQKLVLFKPSSSSDSVFSNIDSLPDCVEYSFRSACHFTSPSSSSLLHLSLRLSSPPSCNLSVSCSTPPDQSVCRGFFFFLIPLWRSWGSCGSKRRWGSKSVEQRWGVWGGLNVNCGTQSSLTEL